ncbi:DUF6303 family protein [Streptomyces sp. enrichment culture]|uniref:DUF6303 family protein n=1 Tax=Streptomyces sp. enrichment culture TaxID=1795815 RepID=UPI003F55923C
MSNTGRAWHLYVVLYGETEWPTFQWERTARVPTGAERRAALASLGYEVAPGAVWSWTEDSRNHGDDSTPVVLIAAIAVRGQDGGAA